MTKKAGIMILGVALLTSFAINIQAAKPTVKISAGPGTVMASASTTVTVNQPQPQVSLKAFPIVVLPGKSTILCWLTKNVDSTTIDNVVGDVPTNGSIQVSPVATTIYTITATEPGGTTNAAFTVSIDDMLQPSVSIYSSLEIVDSGGEIVLSWNAPHAESASIDNGIGSVPSKGSLRVTPGQTTTYTITAENRNGMATASVKVVVKFSPKCYAYVPNSSDNTVSVIDITNYPKTVKAIPVGNQPQSCVFSPDGMFVYIGNYSSQSISVIDTGINTVLSTISIGGAPQYLAFHPGGKLLYAIVKKVAAETPTYAIDVINTETGRIVNELELGNNCLNGIVLHPDGSRLYVAAWDKVLVIDTASTEIMFNIPAAWVFDLALSPDGNRLYAISNIVNGENVSVIDTDTNSVIRKLTVYTSIGNHAELIDVAAHPFVNKLYVISKYDPHFEYLSYIDTSTFEVKKADEFMAATPKSLAIKPDGSRLFVVSDNLNLFSTDTDTHEGSVNLGRGSIVYGNFVGYTADTVAGKVTQNNIGVEGITLTITGEGITKTLKTDVNGNYFVSLKNGTYTITPSRGNDVFSPQNLQAIINKSLSGQDFKIINIFIPSIATLSKTPKTIKAGSSDIPTDTAISAFSGASVWKKINKNGPASRSGHAMAYDVVNKLALVYGGGAASGGELDDFWKWDGLKWTKIVGYPRPGYRSDHAIAYDANRKMTVFFGGWKSGYGNPYKGDTWEWNGLAWKQINKTGPSGREKHAMVYDSKRKRIVLFGGYDGNNRLNDTWAYTASGWKKLASSGPPGLLRHSMAYDAKRDRIVLFGGYSNSGFNGDTWLWNGTMWTKSTEQGPLPRSGVFMCYNAKAGIAMLFGGEAGAYPNYVYYNDTWIWNGSKWTELKISGPSSRSDHRMVYDSVSGNIFLFGGDDPKAWSALRDSWTFTYK